MDYLANALKARNYGEWDRASAFALADIADTLHKILDAQLTPSVANYEIGVITAPKLVPGDYPQGRETSR